MAEVILYDLGPYKLHTYVAPEQSFGDATHILETPNQLIVVDTQYSLSEAGHFRRYAEATGKPVKNIIISHAHPDHFLGLQAFKGTAADVWATPRVIQSIKKKGPEALEHSKKILGADSATELIVPNKEICTQSMVIDGLKLEFLEVECAEARYQLVIFLPELNVLIAQDIVYNNYHPYLHRRYLKSWINILEQIRCRYDRAQLILAGHGDPASPDIFASMICYLEKVLKICSRCHDPEAHKEYLQRKFPDYKGAQIMDMYLPAFYS